MKLSSKVSPFIQKLEHAPDGYWFEPAERPAPIDVLAPRLGPYFCYRALMDPALLSDILGLPEKPTLRPARRITDAFFRPDAGTLTSEEALSRRIQVINDLVAFSQLEEPSLRAKMCMRSTATSGSARSI
jgi:hypothetical protein